MSAIPCASVSLKTMADGTLRISFDIEPIHAQDAFKLFANPGTPAAIAALQVGYAAVVEPLEEPAKEPIGPLCKLAVQWCRDPMFWEYLTNKCNRNTNSETLARINVCEICNVFTRKALDTDAKAIEKFHKQIRVPYQIYMSENKYK